MIATDLVEKLAQHRTIGAAPHEELRWLAEHGTLRLMQEGDYLSHKGEPVEGMFIILSGHIILFADRGGGSSKMAEWTAGDVGGLLPFSRMTNAPGNSIAQEPTEVLALPAEKIRVMTHECFEVTSLLVHRMVDRARQFTSSELHDEKMVSLGKLSAGLAHELNNPAAAIERSASLLVDRVEEAEHAARELESARLSDEQLATVDAIREACLKKPASERSALDLVDREDAFAEWLSAHKVNALIAPTLAETEVTFDALNALAQAVPGEALGPVLRWSAAGSSTRSLASEIRDCVVRISCLIKAIKGFTHMDQGIAAEEVSVATGLQDAVTVLRAKATQRSIDVAIDVEQGLPQIVGHAAELNQIWGILIDNALDAAPEHGLVQVSARQEGQRLAVRITDNGTGVSDAIRSRIFDPFFTTKPMGYGTGLGLDIAQRLVRHNNGTIEFDSEPGRTEFRVYLPARP